MIPSKWKMAIFDNKYSYVVGTANYFKLAKTHSKTHEELTDNQQRIIINMLKDQALADFDIEFCAHEIYNGYCIIRELDFKLDVNFLHKFRGYTRLMINKYNKYPLVYVYKKDQLLGALMPAKLGVND